MKGEEMMGRKQKRGSNVERPRKVLVVNEKKR